MRDHLVIHHRVNAGQGNAQPVQHYLLRQNRLSAASVSRDMRPKAVTRVDSRSEALKKVGRCFICLRRGHISRTCQSRIKCLNCRGRHHVAICSAMTD